MQIDAITIGKRRRDDLGDIDGLAESIQRVGLIHPVVVDDAGQLVAGGRRLEACRRLGWAEILTRSMGDLSPAEQREIELEENLHRKDLTQLERDKTLVELMETAAEVLREEAQATETVFPDSGKTNQNAAKPDSLEKIAERTGVPRNTLWEAREHVDAKAAHPDLADTTKTVAIQEARRRKQASAPRPRNTSQPPPRRAKPRMRMAGTAASLWLKELKTFTARWDAMGGPDGLLAAIATWDAAECVTLGQELAALSGPLTEAAQALLARKDGTHGRAS